MLTLNHRTVENPFAVAFGKENVACFFDAFQNFAVCAAANSLRRQQACAFAFSMFNLLRAFSNQ